MDGGNADFAGAKICLPVGEGTRTKLLGMNLFALIFLIFLRVSLACSYRVLLTRLRGSLLLMKQRVLIRDLAAPKIFTKQHAKPALLYYSANLQSRRIL